MPKNQDSECKEIIPINKKQFIEEYEAESKGKPIVNVDIGTHSCNICS